MQYALITGGAGFIGSYICRNLLENGIVDKVVVLDHFGRYVNSVSRGFIDFRPKRFQGIESKVVIERGEARFYGVVYNIVSKYLPKYIFHLASLPLAKIQNLNVQETIEGTVVSTSSILEIIGTIKKRSGYDPERFVYTSSSMVYGDWQEEEATEEHPKNPKEVYGAAKLAGETITTGLSTFYGIKYTIIRPSAVYGPYDMNRRVSQIFLEKAINNELIKIQGKDEKLDFSYVLDVAQGFVQAATHPAGANQTFNITSGEARTLLEFVQVLKTYYPELRYEIYERDSFRPRRGTLSITKARKVIGYEPRYSLESGIAEYIEKVAHLLKRS